MRLRVAGANTRNKSRGTAPALVPNGSKFTDGTLTNGWTTQPYDADPQKFADRWNNTGSNNSQDVYSGNLDWVITPQFFANIQSGYLVYNTMTPPEFAGTSLIHSFRASNVNYLDVPSSLQQPNGYSDNKSTSRTVKDLYSRAYVNANTTLYKSWKGEHTAKFGVRFERLGNDVDTGPQQPTINLYWGQTRQTLDQRSVRGKYGYYYVSRGAYTNGTVSSNNWSFWAQDSWTIGSKLTINAGVRTENEHVPSYTSTAPGIDFGFRDKFAPRVGFAYDLKGDSTWKLYGDYGKYYDITKLEMPRGSFGAEHWNLYYYTLDTFDWTSISCQEGPTGCPGTFIEQVDNRHPANAVDPKLTSYFGHPQNTIDPNIKPLLQNEASFGLEHQLTQTMSVGARYTHRWLTRTIEDTGISVPGVGEVFFIANPGFGVASQILPPPAPVEPHAIRDYDGVEFRLQKRLSQSWSLNTSYLLSRLRGNYSGLASSDENGRDSPNVNRYFDALYMSYDASGNGKDVRGLLPTDRPHQMKAQLTYSAPWGTSVGLASLVETGTPQQSQLSWKAYPIYFNGRGDLGRTPVYSQFDVFLQHTFRLIGNQHFNVNVNVTNLFDQQTVTGLNTSPWRESFNGSPIVPANQNSDPYFFGGFSPTALVAAMRAAGSTMRDDPRYLLASGYQNRRQLRIGVKYSF